MSGSREGNDRGSGWTLRASQQYKRWTVLFLCKTQNLVSKEQTLVSMLDSLCLSLNSQTSVVGETQSPLKEGVARSLRKGVSYPVRATCEHSSYLFSMEWEHPLR